MVDANIQREDVLISEKARAYRMKYDAMKHQGTAGGSSLKDTISHYYTAEVNHDMYGKI